MYLHIDVEIHKWNNEEKKMKKYTKGEKNQKSVSLARDTQLAN
jgi:hypothetical protein